MPAATAEATRSHRRTWGLLILTILVVAAYAATICSFDLTHTPAERSFGAGPDVTQRLKIYLQPISVDPLNQAMQIRVDLSPDRGFGGARPGSPDRPLKVSVASDDTLEQREFLANEPMGHLTVEPSLTQGSVVDYPFDHYVVDLDIRAFEDPGQAAQIPHAIPAGVTVWEGLLGYTFQAHEMPGSSADVIRLRFDLRRTMAHIFFALAFYAAMLVLACSALAISCLVFIGHRRPEAPLVAALAALVFVLPTLRNMIPAAPPLGVWADIAVFLWAELAAVISVALMVWRWARPVSG